jgi:hypothetical protein
MIVPVSSLCIKWLPLYQSSLCIMIAYCMTATSLCIMIVISINIMYHDFRILSTIIIMHDFAYCAINHHAVKIAAILQIIFHYSSSIIHNSSSLFIIRYIHTHYHILLYIIHYTLYTLYIIHCSSSFTIQDSMIHYSTISIHHNLWFIIHDSFIIPTTSPTLKRPSSTAMLP